MTEVLEFPLIYCNGDSYTTEWYHKSLRKSTYDYVVGDYFSGFVMNRAISGSCNRRIIRTSIADLMQQRELNKGQRIIALIGLSFELRSEFWNEDMLHDDSIYRHFLKKDVDSSEMQFSSFESNFRSYQFATKVDWLEQLMAGKTIASKKVLSNTVSPKFFNMLTKSRAFFYSPYAERINLYCDLILFRALMKELDIEFLVFNAPPQETKMSKEFLLDHFSKEIFSDKRFIGFEDDFNFCQHLKKHNFIPIDPDENPDLGHYGPDGHEFFAKDVLIPLLEDPKI